MDELTPSGLERLTGAESGIERSIRYAVYLTGGLVLLALGVLEFAGALGTVLGCLSQNTFCSGGFSNQIYYQTLPILGGAAFLLAVATALFVMARRTRLESFHTSSTFRSPPVGEPTGHREPPTS